MAKIIDYPRASLANAMQLAEAVDSLGGSAKTAMAAEKMGRRVSGAFNAVVSAAVKYALLSTKDGRLNTTSLYRNIKLAYTEEERRGRLREALLSPPIFESIAQRFSGKQLPIEHFDRLLIREFDVSDEIAPRVATYFIDGAQQAGILGAGNVLDGNSREEIGDSGESFSIADERNAKVSSEGVVSAGRDVAPETSKSAFEFSVVFRGPGLSSTVTISDEDDMAIVEATLRKITKALKTREQAAGRGEPIKDND